LSSLAKEQHIRKEESAYGILQRFDWHRRKDMHILRNGETGKFRSSSPHPEEAGWPGLPKEQAKVPTGLCQPVGWILLKNTRTLKISASLGDDSNSRETSSRNKRIVPSRSARNAEMEGPRRRRD
jgi:hypothetical protein